MSGELRPEDLYEIAVTFSEEDDCYVARSPQFPFSSAHGDPFEEALCNARASIAATLDFLKETDRPVPSPCDELVLAEILDILGEAEAWQES
jgi:predicted RNase H-like HicB family nuclease